MNAIGSGYTLALPAKTVRSPILAEPSGKCVRQGRISALHTHARRPSGLVTRSWTTRPKYQPWLPSRKATSISPCLCGASASYGSDLVQRVKHGEQEHKTCTRLTSNISMQCCAVEGSAINSRLLQLCSTTTSLGRSCFGFRQCRMLVSGRKSVRKSWMQIRMCRTSTRASTVDEGGCDVDVLEKRWTASPLFPGAPFACWAWCKQLQLSW